VVLGFVDPGIRGAGGLRTTWREMGAFSEFQWQWGGLCHWIRCRGTTIVWEIWCNTRLR